MKRRNRYLDELGIPRAIYAGNFVTEKKLHRMRQRFRYGFDYRDIFNMDSSFAEWLYSHMRMYKDNSVHDDTQNAVIFEEKEYTVEEAMDWIIEKTGAFLRHSYYIDTHFDYVTEHPIIGKLICRINPATRSYLQEYNKKYEDEYHRFEDDKYIIEEEFIKATKLFVEIMGYCWL